MNYYIDAFKNYANFSGRARRKEYWMFVLFNAIVASILLLVFVPLLKGLGTALYVIYGLAVIVPSLALTVRRLHDINKGWGWIFIALVPFVGSIWLLVLLCLDSEQGSNLYGDNPKLSM